LPFRGVRNNRKTKDFSPFFHAHSRPTDDSVLTIAVADGFVNCPRDGFHVLPTSKLKQQAATFEEGQVSLSIGTERHSPDLFFSFL